MSQKKPPQEKLSASRRFVPRRATVIKLFLVCVLICLAWLIYLDAQVRHRFEGRRWEMPAQVYARALEIYEGRALNLKNLQQELALLQYAKTARASEPGTYAVSGDRVSIFARAHVLPEGPRPANYFQFSLKGDVVADLSSSGNLKLFTLEPMRIGGIYPNVKEERRLLAYHELPSDLVRALLATEDRDFFEHWGISPLSIARAMWANFRAQRVVQGGSTLTQQLVKNFYLTRERSLWRKANEALMALLLELHYGKEDILETYANDIYLGQSGATAVHGFAMGAQFYFGKELPYCDTHELALLVALIKGPSYYDPRRHTDRAKERRNLVLRLMLEQGDITQQQYALLAAKPLGLVSKPKVQTNRYPAFMDLVKRQLSREYHEEDLRSAGLRIYTTLDPQMQALLERSSQRVMADLSQRESEELQLGAIFTGVGTGEVLAIVGDRNARYPGFNRALDASRQIGSLIKPAVYLTALERPQRYHLASELDDTAFKIRFENGEEWQPQNFDEEEHGKLPLYQALARSLNIPSARLGLDVGVDEVRDTLKRLGVEEALNPYPSILLGAQSLSPFQVSKFYQTIASNGFNMPLRAIREVQTQQGETLSRYGFDIKQVIAPQAMYLLHYAMREGMLNGTGRSAYRRLPKALEVAGKTGTTNDHRDSWFAGFSGDYLGVVWLGYDDNRTTGLTGSSGALKVWTDFMASVPQYPLDMRAPDSVDLAWFKEQNWHQTDEQCKGALPLPVWGKPNVDYEPCREGYSSFKGWIKSWF